MFDPGLAVSVKVPIKVKPVVLVGFTLTVPVPVFDELKSASVLDPNHPWIVHSLANVFLNLQQWDSLYEHGMVHKSRLDKETYLHLLEGAAFHQLEGQISDKKAFYQIFN